MPGGVSSARLVLIAYRLCVPILKKIEEACPIAENIRLAMALSHRKLLKSMHDNYLWVEGFYWFMGDLDKFVEKNIQIVRFYFFLGGFDPLDINPRRG